MTLAEALRYQQELDAAQRPAYGNPNLAAQGRNANIAERSRAFPFMQAADAQFQKEKSSLSDPRATTDLINKGFIAGLGGAPVDLINMGLTPLGMGSAFPFGGSEHIKRAMEDYGVATPTERPIMEGIASLTPPRAVIGAARFAGQGAEAVGRAATEIANAEMAGRAGLSGQGGAITYYGSPHRFPPTANNPLGEFDASKIGTGEGAQAYGHGLYLAEKPGLAEFSEALSNGANKFAKENPDTFERYFKELQKNHPTESASSISFASDLKAIQNGIKPKHNISSALQNEFAYMPEINWGNLYKVDLSNEQIAKMLDWNIPLKDQNPAIQKTLQDLVKTDALGRPTGISVDSNMNGQWAYERLAGIRGAKYASEAMREAGIPGIRYQGSRAAPSSAQFVKKDVVGAADDLTALAKSMGLDAEVRHSGSNAGKSSYVSVFDPMTNYYINSFRISDHGTGPLRTQDHIHINSFADLAAYKNYLFEWVKRHRTEKGVDTTDLSAPSQGTSNFVVFDPAHMNIIGRE